MKGRLRDRLEGENLYISDDTLSQIVSAVTDILGEQSDEMPAQRAVPFAHVSEWTARQIQAGFDGDYRLTIRSGQVPLYTDPPRSEEKPIFWYRPVDDEGGYEGPHHASSSLGKMFRDLKPGQWKPLYSSPFVSGNAGFDVLDERVQAIAQSTAMDGGPSEHDVTIPYDAATLILSARRNKSRTRLTVLSLEWKEDADRGASVTIADAPVGRYFIYKMTGFRYEASGPSGFRGTFKRLEVAQSAAQTHLDGLVSACLSCVVEGVHVLPQPVEEDRADAERFRALLRCGRIKMQGSSGVDPKTGERNGRNVHFGAEFWPESIPEGFEAQYEASTKWGRFCIKALADAILEEEAARVAIATTTENSNV